MKAAKSYRDSLMLAPLYKKDMKKTENKWMETTYSNGESVYGT